MKYLMILAAAAVLAISATSHAGFQGVDGTGKSLGIFDTLKCADGASCVREKGAFKLSGTGKRAQTSVTGATALTAAQCGQTFKNSAASVTTLPSATAALLGCRMSFIVANASNFDVDPTGTETILVLTNAAGDSIRAAVLGTSVTLEAVSVGNWAPVAVSGTWADNN